MLVSYRGGSVPWAVWARRSGGVKSSLCPPVWSRPRAVPPRLLLLLTWSSRGHALYLHHLIEKLRTGQLSRKLFVSLYRENFDAAPSPGQILKLWVHDVLRHLCRTNGLPFHNYQYSTSTLSEERNFVSPSPLIRNNHAHLI